MESANSNRSGTPQATPQATPQPQEEPDVITDLPVLHTAKRLKVEARKLDGMQRELYSLIGDSQPPVVVTPDSKFKTRPEWQQRASSWKEAEFEPKPGLKLKHWVRAANIADGTAGDRFAKFNTPVSVPEWTDNDYRLFESEDWSLDETRYLFDLARDFDLRWLVMHDRYEFSGKSRSIEDLKERYYAVASTLIEQKPASMELGLSPHDEELLQAMKFPKERELRRKAHLERLLKRTPKEIAEEEALILEARRLEFVAGKLLTEREQLLELLDSPQTDGTKAGKKDLSTSQGVGQLLQELQNEKSRKIVPAAPAPKNVANIIASALNRKLTQREEITYGISYTENMKVKHSGVFLRSAKLMPIRQSLLPKVRAVTSELGIPLRPVMPTARVCTRYESLYQSITILLEAKKVQDRLEMEIDVIKRAQAQQRGQSVTPAQDGPGAEQSTPEAETNKANNVAGQDA